jgi:hypothetical protein
MIKKVAHNSSMEFEFYRLMKLAQDFTLKDWEEGRAKVEAAKTTSGLESLNKVITASKKLKGSDAEKMIQTSGKKAVEEAGKTVAEGAGKAATKTGISAIPVIGAIWDGFQAIKEVAEFIASVKELAKEINSFNSLNLSIKDLLSAQALRDKAMDYSYDPKNLASLGVIVFKIYGVASNLTQSIGRSTEAIKSVILTVIEGFTGPLGVAGDVGLSLLISLIQYAVEGKVQEIYEPIGNEILQTFDTKIKELGGKSGGEEKQAQSSEKKKDKIYKRAKRKTKNNE